MAFPPFLALGFLFLLTFLGFIQPRVLYFPSSSDFDNLLLLPSEVESKFTRSDFPDDFIFGTAAASYQFEGAVKEGGREPSIWDYFTHAFPAKNQNDTGDIAVDFYHRYRQDIQLMKDMHMDAFRLSISWSRILPYGKLESGVSIEGVLFYKDLIDELVANGIKPSVTIFHWDLPETLEEEYGGFRSANIVEDYRNFAKLCFHLYGDKVSFWATFNEPWVFSVAGYDKGIKAPGRCSEWRNNSCVGGDSSVEPYIVSHYLLLAHAAAVEEFRKCDKCKDGQIGIVLCPAWYLPYSDSEADKEAVIRSLDFMLGWHLSPLTFGDYPDVMKNLVGSRLPNFTEEEKTQLRGSFDYIGLNYYGAKFVANIEKTDPTKPSYTTDMHVNWTNTNVKGDLLGPLMASDIPVFPEGLKYIVNYTKDNYNNPIIHITENGYDDFNNATLPLEKALNDTERKEYHKNHLEQLSISINDYGARVKSYFAWSLMDNFEWNMGYTVRFGLIFVDYKNNLTRYPKESAKWFMDFLNKKNKKQTDFASLDFTPNYNEDLISSVSH